MSEIENPGSEFNRRDFLKGSSLAALMTMMGGVELMAQPAGETRAEPMLTGPKVRLGLIGLGPQGREILDQLGRLSQAEIAALCDHYPAMLRRSASKAPNARLVEDYKSILADTEIPAVLVATGTHQHKDIVLAALKAGKHVYCEAPLAHTSEDARAMALAAKAAVGQLFQPGLQARSDPQRHFLLPFLRSGALGKFVMARAQWHRKNSWRQTSPNPQRDQEINWRLDRGTSLGLAGEIGIHQFDQAGWLMNNLPTAVQGYSSLIHWNDDGRTVPDTLQLVLEFPNGVRLLYDATLGSSFDAEYEMYYGTDATVMIRDHKAWMFKEVDSPLLGWEVYARKENFYKETGIALVAGGSKQAATAEKPAEEGNAFSPLYYALEAFVGNCAEVTAAVEDFTGAFGKADKKALAEYLAGIKLDNAASCLDGYRATVLAIKANEAVVKNTRVELSKEWFELA